MIRDPIFHETPHQLPQATRKLGRYFPTPQESKLIFRQMGRSSLNWIDF
jgi:hypothetical protein